jgi:hypothetical protein
MNAYLRRLSVCDRLREIAQETGNEALRAEAERLEEMAWNVYEQKTNRSLGMSGQALLDDEPPSRSTPQANTPGGSPSPRPTPAAADQRATRNAGSQEVQR